MTGARGFIRLNDDVEGGGRVTTASGSLLMVDGRAVMLEGDLAECATHGGVFPAVEGYDGGRVGDRRIVLHGHRLACGCRLVSSCNGMWGYAPLPTASALDAVSLRAAIASTPRAAAPARSAEDAAGTASPAGITLRIGMFFDGTNNNAANTAQGAICREDDAKAIQACRPYMIKDGSSYQNGLTNIARLFALYRDSSKDVPVEGGAYFVPFYIDGIGTTAGAPDSRVPGQALGTGRTGVVKRVERGIALIGKRIAELTEAWSDLRVAAIEFDLFGFSRGAAAARHAVNQINRRQGGPLADALESVRQYLRPGFDWQRDVRVGFVGLFDTVVATGGLTDGLSVRDDDDRGVQTYLSPDCARKVVQLVARDEMRANFALTSVQPHQEVVLPGAHSDIGGSYVRDREGPLWLSRPFGTDEGPVQAGEPLDDPERMRRSAAYIQCESILRHWQQKLHIDDPTQLRIDSWTWVRSRRDRDHAALQPRRIVYAAVRLERPIRCEYQLIPLRIMHKLAGEAGVEWAQSPDDLPEFTLPTELTVVAEKLLASQPLAPAEEVTLRRDFLHQSSHWNADALDKFGPAATSLDLVYISRPDPSGSRTVRPNR